jgi:hypothetical protein
MKNNEKQHKDVFPMSSETMNRLLDIGGNALYLYSFYLLESYKQGTDEITCHNDHVSKQIGWGKDKISKTRQILIANEFIEPKQLVNSEGNFEGKTIKLNFPIINNVGRL